MKSIDILRDQPECIVRTTFKFYKGDVGGIGLFRGNQFTSPVVPFPHQPWVPFEGLGRCQILCAKVAPQAVRSAKGRYPAIGRNAGSREDGYVVSGREECAGLENLIVSSHGRVCEVYRISSQRICVL
jgi:hypothetical protein